MLSKYRQKRQEGFTIIEVLIVLAIAGLILLVVFLAVPALQRNNRNTQRDNDVANILGGLSEYVNNNSGRLPATTEFSGDATTLTIGSSSSNQVEVNLGYYDGGNDVSAASGDASNTADENSLIVVLGARCGSGQSEHDAVEGPSRGYVILYEKEVDASQCRES